MVLNQDLQDFEDFYQPGLGLGWCVLQHINYFLSTIFTFRIHLNFRIIGSCPVLWFLNQDLQDFEDFYQRGVGLG